MLWHQAPRATPGSVWGHLQGLSLGVGRTLKHHSLAMRWREEMATAGLIRSACLLFHASCRDAWVLPYLVLVDGVSAVLFWVLRILAWQVFFVFFTEIWPIKPEDLSIVLFEAVLYSMLVLRKLVNRPKLYTLVSRVPVFFIHRLFFWSFFLQSSLQLNTADAKINFPSAESSE